MKLIKPKNDYSYWTKLDTHSVDQWFEKINGGENPERLQALNMVRTLDPKTILEVGPGNGRDYLAMQQIMPQSLYCAVDVSSTIVNKLKEKFTDINILQANLYDGLPFENNTFDVVFGRHILEHMPYYEKPIKEMLRVANKGVVISMFRSFVKKDDLRYVEGRNDNRYCNKKFITFVSELGYKIELVNQHNKIKKILIIRKTSGGI